MIVLQQRDEFRTSEEAVFEYFCESLAEIVRLVGE